jgi:catechol 2,3-dioxygenase-like lactoylglutathione lyase family enzyme
MVLNHINLVVADVEASIKLFETHFNFKCEAVKGDNAIAILKGSDGFTLVLMTNKMGAVEYPDAFHIGLMLSSEEEVTRCFESLKNGGIALGKDPGKIRDTFGFYFNFDSFMIEVGYSN